MRTAEYTWYKYFFFCWGAWKGQPTSAKSKYRSLSSPWYSTTVVLLYTYYRPCGVVFLTPKVTSQASAACPLLRGLHSVSACRSLELRSRAFVHLARLPPKRFIINRQHTALILPYSLCRVLSLPGGPCCCWVSTAVLL